MTLCFTYFFVLAMAEQPRKVVEQLTGRHWMRSAPGRPLQHSDTPTSHSLRLVNDDR